MGAIIAENKADAIFHGGDLSYADGYMSIWDFWLQQITPLSASVPYLTIMGNHEMDWPGIPEDIFGNESHSSGGECGVVAMKLLPMPAPARTYTPYWSYDIGLIHIVGIETEQNFSIGSPQYKWLQADLAGVNRSITPWVVVHGHRPMYVNSNQNGSLNTDQGMMTELINNLEPLLWKYNTNVAMWGHNHAAMLSVVASLPHFCSDHSANSLCICICSGRRQC